MRDTQQPNLRVALAGNPNSGKSSLFNALTGARQQVGNYPGVTVEKRQSSYRFAGGRFELVDLPGTYSLSCYTPEERIAQEELVRGDLTVVVVVVDATALKRSLVLLAQLMLTGATCVLCLNMSDEAARAGQRLDLVLLSQLLGMPVVETVGHRGQGVATLKQAIARVARHSGSERRLVLGERLDQALGAVALHLVGSDLPDERLRWIACKLLQGDHATAAKVVREAGGEDALAAADHWRRLIEAQTGRDIALVVMESYYGFVDGLLRQTMLADPRADARALSDRIDALLAHRLLGVPFFLAVMYGIFWLTFSLGEIPMGWLEAGFAALGGWVSGLWPAGSDSLLRSLLVDGIIAGVGGVLVFLPNIVLLFVGLALLEDTGYMARAAFLMDRVMHRFGLHGRSFVPLVTGFGCSVPGIMATRTLEHEHDRLATMLVLPLMSCGARLTIWMLLIPAFFPPAWRAPVLWGLYLTGVVLALSLALLLRRTLLRGEEAPFVMELPPYRLPTARAVVLKMSERSWLYLRKAGTIILAISILMWAITSYPRVEPRSLPQGPPAVAVLAAPVTGEQGQPVQEESLRHSLAGRIGRALEPLLSPAGLDWKVGTALIGAFAAKEVFVAQLGIIYAVGDAESDRGAAKLRDNLQRDYSRLSAVALMLFLLVATPCMATLAVTRRESGSWRWALLQLGGLTLLGYLLALSVYQGGRLLFG